MGVSVFLTKEFVSLYAMVAINSFDLKLFYDFSGYLAYLYIVVSISSDVSGT